jgi:hypothetical protein
MKLITGCLLVSLLLLACRKERINPADIRLLKATVSGPGGSKLNTNFEYDNQGRIVRVTRDIDNTNQKLIATVSYNGNEAILIDSSENFPGSKIIKTIKFLLDNQNKPLQRTQIETRQFSNVEFEQRNFINDTTYYEYNSAGLLTQTKVFNRDSVWSLYYTNITPSTTTNLKSRTRSFQESNGNIISMSGSGTRFLSITDATGIFRRNFTVQELISFDYSNGFKNQTDFKNAFILAEYGGNHYLSVLNPTSQSIPIFSFLNPSAKNIPNKRVTSITEKDNTGVEVYNYSDTPGYNIFYNRYGFVSGIANSNATNPDLVLTYNK